MTEGDDTKKYKGTYEMDGQRGGKSYPFLITLKDVEEFGLFHGLFSAEADGTAVIRPVGEGQQYDDSRRFDIYDSYELHLELGNFDVKICDVELGMRAGLPVAPRQPPVGDDGNTKSKAEKEKARAERNKLSNELSAWLRDNDLNDYFHSLQGHGVSSVMQVRWCCSLGLHCLYSTLSVVPFACPSQLANLPLDELSAVTDCYHYKMKDCGEQMPQWGIDRITEMTIPNPNVDTLNFVIKNRAMRDATSMLQGASRSVIP